MINIVFECPLGLLKIFQGLHYTQNLTLRTVLRLSIIVYYGACMSAVAPQSYPVVEDRAGRNRGGGGAARGLRGVRRRQASSNTSLAWRGTKKTKSSCKVLEVPSTHPGSRYFIPKTSDATHATIAAWMYAASLR